MRLTEPKFRAALAATAKQMTPEAVGSELNSPSLSQDCDGEDVGEATERNAEPKPQEADVHSEAGGVLVDNPGATDVQRKHSGKAHEELWESQW